MWSEFCLLPVKPEYDDSWVNNQNILNAIVIIFVNKKKNTENTKDNRGIVIK